MSEDAIVIAKLNVQYYQRLLSSDLSESKRATVERLLDEERRIIAALEGAAPKKNKSESLAAR